jgi:hypothetical protein
MTQKSLRFGIQDENGQRAATWKLWTETSGDNSEVYLTCRALGGVLKSSLHQSGNWHTAYSPIAFEKLLKGQVTETQNRFIQKWPKPKEIASGITLAFRIVTPWSAVSNSIEAGNHSKVKWLENAPEGKATEIDILYSKPTTIITDWPGKSSMGTRLIGNIPLNNGETVWAVCWIVDMPNFESWPKKLDMNYFNGCGKEDLKEDGLRMLVFGSEPDGSRTMFDFAVLKESK